jgi:fatty-acyl-CoA synthase
LLSRFNPGERIAVWAQNIPEWVMLETVRSVAPNRRELREIVCFDDWNAFIAPGDDETIELPAVNPGDPVP